MRHVRCPCALLVAALCLPTGTPREVVADNAGTSPVTLLRFPYPYRAAVTITSDTHATTVPHFEAVHKLVNTLERIERDSPEWALLFSDPAIDSVAAWRDGIDGFGLPISDTFWLYNPWIGAFDHFDARAQRAVPHDFDGVDYRTIMDRWFERGWIDALHSGGTDDLPREAMVQGLAWLQQDPRRHVSVLVNHSISANPAAVEPDVMRALPFTLKNIARAIVAIPAKLNADKPVARLLRQWRLGGLAGKVSSPTRLYAFPPDQAFVCWLDAAVVALALLALGAVLARRRWRTRRHAVVCGVLLLASAAHLATLPIRYAQGDNRGSRYYSMDILKAAGFRFFWLVSNVGNYHSLAGDLALPEVSWGERRSFLRTVTMDDGNQVLVFPRNFKGMAGAQSLELLTPAALDRLCEHEGAAILYTHWSSPPNRALTARGLEGLWHLQRYFSDGRVWVAPTHELLQFELARTFVRYSVESDGSRYTIDIERIESPVAAVAPPSIEDVKGLSFECPAGSSVEVRLGGKLLPSGDAEHVDTGRSLVVRLRSADRGDR